MARRLPIVAALLAVVGAACSADKGPPFLAPAPSTTANGVTSSLPPAQPLPSGTALGGPGDVTLLVSDVRLVNSEESDNAFRALVDSTAAEVRVKVTGVPTPNQVILVCPVNDLTKRTAPATDCVKPASGEVVKAPHGTAYKGVEVVQVGVSGAGPGGNSTAISEIAISYPAASRKVQVRLPPLQQGEGGSRPTFRMTPVGPGAYTATATFTTMTGAPGEAELTLVSGTANQNLARGPGPSLSGNLSPPAEAGFRLRNSGSITLTAVTLDAQFP